jgi:hypothetical protein
LPIQKNLGVWLYIHILELLIQDRTWIVYFSALDHHIYKSPGLLMLYSRQIRQLELWFIETTVHGFTWRCTRTQPIFCSYYLMLLAWRKVANRVVNITFFALIRHGIEPMIFLNRVTTTFTITRSPGDL